MPTPEEEIEEILVDSYDIYEQMASWEYAFTTGTQVPCRASLLGITVEVQKFRVSDSNVLQCLVVREKEKRQRWISVEDLDEENLPEDFRHMLTLYRTWAGGED